MKQELQKEQKCSFYALEQLRQTAEAILRGSQRLLKCRAGVEKYRTAQPQRAYAYYLELQKMRDVLVGALGDAQRNLLELEEPVLAGKAGQLQAGLGRFDLMSRAYKPVYEVLTGFANALPQTDTVNAAVIGRRAKPSGSGSRSGLSRRWEGSAPGLSRPAAHGDRKCPVHTASFWAETNRRCSCTSTHLRSISWMSAQRHIWTASWSI